MLPSALRRLRSLRPALLLSLFSRPALGPARAQDAQETPDAKKTRTSADAGPQKETLSETSHSVTVEGRPLAYRALAGDLVLPDEAGKPKARMFYVAYLKDVKKGDELRRRPLTFVWNGGPGSSAVWLHLGALGPQRVDVDPEGVPAAPPHRLVPTPTRCSTSPTWSSSIRCRPATAVRLRARTRSSSTMSRPMWSGWASWSAGS